MKKCPYCAESIQDEAIKCRHCSEMLDRPTSKQPPPTSGNSSQIMDIVAWSNVVAWLIPIIGLIVSIITFTQAKKAAGKVDRYYTLAAIGISLSFIMFVIGFLMAF